MKRGERMPNKSKKKISNTKRRRIERQKIADEVVHLLLIGKDIEAGALAKHNSRLFMIGGE